jgi:DNA-binding CsgD family transcriptional regulator
MLAHVPGTEDAKVAAVLHDAAEQALRRGAIEVAAELDEQSARFTPAARREARQRLELRSARQYHKAGDPGRSRALCAAVLGAEPSAALRAEALHLLAEVQALEQVPGALPLLHEALAAAGDDVTRAAQLEIALAVVSMAGIEPAESLRHASRALELAERAGDPTPLAEALALRESIRVSCGDGFDPHAVERTLALEDVEREVSFQVRPSFRAASVHWYVLRPDLARPLLVALRERLVARGEEADLPWVLIGLGVASHQLGELERAEAEATEAERAALLTGGEVFCAFAQMLRALVRATRGDAGRARAEGERARDLRASRLEGGASPTRRVAQLAAQGLTNPDIAARLFMARRTVEANLARAYGKLGIRSRAELGPDGAARAPYPDSPFATPIHVEMTDAPRRPRVVGWGPCWRLTRSASTSASACSSVRSVTTSTSRYRSGATCSRASASSTAHRRTCVRSWPSANRSWCSPLRCADRNP